MLISALLLWLALTALWLLSLRLQDASIVDIFWGLGFLLCAGIYWFANPASPRALLVLGLVAIWSLRLAGYIGWRNHGKGEDYRYRTWRAQHGKNWWWRSYLQVFLLQGVLLWIISSPLYAAQSAPTKAFGLWDALGVLVWAVGLFFESVGDWQLARFKADPHNKGKLMQTGLWQYTRHPNYFGDFCVWWGLFLLALSVGGAWSIFSPILMSFLLMRVSGVAMTERAMSNRAGFAEYARRTNAFFPWFPRKNA